jgi:RNA polymerase-binding transcription factor DksA
MKQQRCIQGRVREMGFQGKKNKQLPSGRKGDALKNVSGNAFSKGSKKQTSEKPSGAVAPQKRVLRTASPADILGVQSKPSVPKKEASVPKKWEPFYRKLLRLQTLLTDSNVTPQEDDEELLEFVFDRSRTLAEVRAAIERIFKGTYGICELTRKPIALERLSAIPYTRYSLEGQRQAEALRSDAFSSEEEAFDIDADGEGLSYTPDELSDE